MKKKKSLRAKTKFPALNPELNIKSRRFFIEPEYINGVYDKDGNQVIRPLNDEEKAWLNKFYEETIVTNFQKDGSDFYSEQDERRMFYRENNKRNVCLFNLKQRTGLLESFSISKVDKLYIKSIETIDYENYIIKILEKNKNDDDEL